MSAALLEALTHLAAAIDASDGPLVRHQALQPSELAVDLDELRASLGCHEAPALERHGGRTVQAENVGWIWPCLWHVVGAIHETFAVVGDISVYDTAGAGIRTFDVHHDYSDFLVVQLEGTKRWQVFRRHGHAPYPTDDVPLHDASEPPVLDVELAPGDVAFVRWGDPHRVTSTGDSSLHLSAKLIKPTSHDVLGRFLATMMRERAVQPTWPGTGRAAAGREAWLGAYITVLEDALASARAELVPSAFARILGRKLEHLGVPEGCACGYLGGTVSLANATLAAVQCGEMFVTPIGVVDARGAGSAVRRLLSVTCDRVDPVGLAQQLSLDVDAVVEATDELLRAGLLLGSACRP